MIKLRLIVIAVGVMGLSALALGGTASATVLCKENKNPCPAAYPVGTEFAGELAQETTLFTGFSDSCTKSSFTGKVTNAGGSTSTVTVALTSVSWGGCGRTKEVVKLGSLEIHYQEGTYAGLGTLSGLQYKDSFCTYSVATGSNVAVTEGSPNGELLVSTTATAPGCLLQTWEAVFKVTAPSPLFVSAS